MRPLCSRVVLQCTIVADECSALSSSSSSSSSSLLCYKSKVSTLMCERQSYVFVPSYCFGIVEFEKLSRRLDRTSVVSGIRLKESARRDAPSPRVFRAKDDSNPHRSVADIAAW